MPIETGGGVIGDMPHIQGTRIGVHHVVTAFRDRNYSVEEIAREVYPHLSEVEVREALTYALEHPDEFSDLEEQYEQDQDRIEENAVTAADIVSDSS